MTNLFNDSSTLSAFQITREYLSSVWIVPSAIVPENLLNAHIESTANRAIHKICRSRSPGTVRAEHLTPNTREWVFYKSSKHTEPVRLIYALLIKAAAHVVNCRRSEKGLSPIVAYEDIRVAPEENLAA